MPNSRIPSPSRSQGGITPRRYKSRTRSVGSPARSTASGRLSSMVDQFRDKNMDSFVLSPMRGRHSVLSDNTDIEEPRRKSWWKNLNENSREVLEMLSQEVNVKDNKMIEDMMDVELLSQEQKNYTLDLPDSSDGESIHSIVLPQRKLFNQKENQPQKAFGNLIGQRETLAKLNKTNADKTVNAGIKDLFPSSKRSKPVFPAALLNISQNKTIADKTKENIVAEPKAPIRNIFGNRPANKRKKIFVEFIASESEDEISEIQPKQIFNFQKQTEQRRVSRGHSPTSSITTDIETDFLQYLPSSTMVEHQLEDMVAGTPVKKARLSILPSVKESETNEMADTKQTNKSVISQNKSKTSPKANESMNSSRITRSQLKNASRVGENINKSKNQTETNKSKSKVNEKDINMSNEMTETIEKQNVSVLTRSQSRNNSKIKNVPESDNTEVNTVQKQTKESNKSTSKQKLSVSSVSNKSNKQEKSHNKTSDSNHDDVQNDQEEDNFTLTYENDDDEIIDAAVDKLDKIPIQTKMGDKTAKDVTIIEKTFTDAVNKSKNKSLNQSKRSSSISFGNKDIQSTSQIPESDNTIIKNKPNETTSKINKSHRQIEEQNEGVIEFQDKEAEVEKDNNQIEKEPNSLGEKDNELQETNSNKSIDSQNIKINKANESQKVVNEDNDNEDDVDGKPDEVDVSQDIGDEAYENDDINQSQEAADANAMNNSQEDENDEEQDQEEEANESQEVDSENKDSKSQEVESEDENNESQEVDDEDEVNESQEIESEDQANESLEEEDEDPANESEDYNKESDAEVNESQEVEDENEVYESQEVENEDVVNESQEVEDEDEVNESHELDEDEVNESQEVENESETEDQEMAESDNAEAEISDDDNQPDEMEVEQENDEQSDDDDNQNQETNSQEVIEKSPNVTHDTTGRNRNKIILDKSPEAILRDKSKQMHSFINKGRNTSIRETLVNNLNIKPIALPRDSIGFSDGTRDSSAEGSGWDSHRTTRKTLRQTFGKDYTLRKSLRALVMEKSAKRQTEFLEQADNITVKFPQANSTEREVTDMSDRAVCEESVNVMSPRTKQKTLEMYQEKIQQQNLEIRLKIEEAVRISLKRPQYRDPLNLFKVPTKPPPRRAKPIATKTKPTKFVIPLGELPSELIDDMKYKPPKRFRPSNASWITKRLYKYLETKLETNYDYKARLRAEKLVESIYEFTKTIKRHNVAPTDSTEVLKHELARLDVVKTHFDFYEFIREFLPREVRTKVIPDIVNNLPLPRHGVFTDILRGNTVQG